MLAEDSELHSEATYYGPAYMNTYMSGQMNGNLGLGWSVRDPAEVPTTLTTLSGRRDFN
ncbi:MAG TPA: hypothetical protein VGK97_10050 [Spongiibacteraceae bacterium]